MRTSLALVLYSVAIISLVVLTGFVIWRLIIMPPCTPTGNLCVIEGWSVAGLAGTVLGVAATVLAILGAVAVAGWWLNLEDRVRDQVDKLFDQGVIKEHIDKRISIEVFRSLSTKYELNHLRYFARPEPFLADYNSNFIRELTHLQLLNFIERVVEDEPAPIRSLKAALEQNGQVNVKDYFHITDKGKEYLKQVE